MCFVCVRVLSDFEKDVLISEMEEVNLRFTERGQNKKELVYADVP